MYFAENGSSYYCWMNDLGEVRMGIRTSSGTFSDSLVDTVDASLGLMDVPSLSIRPIGHSLCLVMEPISKWVDCLPRSGLFSRYVVGADDY